MKRILPLLLIIFSIPQINKAQQIGDGWAPVIYNFASALQSGGYNACTSYGLTSGVPDNDHPWQHLFTIRHPNPNNNHQLQLAASFAPNDRLFFRKIAVGDASDGNSNWLELATRGGNTFNGSQTINGEIIWPMTQKNFSAAPREGVNPMSIRLWDNYNGGGPTTYGTLLEIAGRSSHMVSQLYFGGWDNSRIRYREAFYAENQWNEWRYLLDSKNDVESKGNLKITGTANHYIANGNVGIGTTNPQNKLDVNGTIRAKEVKVETGWADFVFTPNYKLRPLTEVEQFIKTNGHLPEIPKAEEVQQNGVNLGEMQTKLLQKVEELTLYSIEQEKVISELKSIVVSLQKEIKGLKEDKTK